MPEMLDKVLTRPIEREFEGWITWLMEDYFDCVGIEARIWSISQTDEAFWPADEAMFLDGKILGLQMKRPDMANWLQLDFSRLKWTLGNNTNQFDLIKERPEIFYCLPTFINREWKKGSLDHCVFWRPKDGESHTSILWYENPNIPQWHGNIERHEKTHRWGGLIERLLDCQFGIVIETAEQWTTYLKELRAKLKDKNYFDGGSDCLVLVNVRIKRRTTNAMEFTLPPLLPPSTNP